MHIYIYIITYKHALDQTKTIVNVTFSNDIHVLRLRDCEKVKIGIQQHENNL